MKKNTIRLSESHLRNMIAESVKKVLKEARECSPNAQSGFGRDEAMVDKIEKWLETVEEDDDYGSLSAELTNSVYADFMYESAHYGYDRRQHRSLQQRFDLDYNNACLIKYTIRQSSNAYGPSSDYSSLIISQLEKFGFDELGTTSNDEYGTYLTYWFLKEYDHPKENYVPGDDEDEDEWY